MYPGKILSYFHTPVVACYFYTFLGYVLVLSHTLKKSDVFHNSNAFVFVSKVTPSLLIVPDFQLVILDGIRAKNN